MRITKYVILILVLSNIFFIAGCGIPETTFKDTGEGQPEELENEDTGIEDVFSEEDIEPPQIPQ